MTAGAGGEPVWARQIADLGPEEAPPAAKSGRVGRGGRGSGGRNPLRLMRSSFPIRQLFLAGLLAASVALHAHDPAPAAPAGQSGATTIVLVRHAEKAADDPRDPSLSAAGQKRAEALASVLEAADVKAAYSTQFKRTRATAEPLAKRLGLSVVERPITGDASTYARDLAREVLAQQAGKTVLIVGHSNTVPDLVKAFSGATIAPLTDEEYDSLFIVVVPPSGGARLFKTRYGPAAPP